MKLLQLNVTANWGSTGKIAEGIGNAAMTRGWDSTIAYGRYMNTSRSNLIKVGNQLDVYAHYAKNRIFDGEGLGSKSATKKLISQIIDLNPDIIHLHNIHDHWLNYPLLFEYLASIKTPVVWTFHDCWAFTGGCHYFDIPYCDKWKQQCMECEGSPKHPRSNFHYNLRKKLFSALRSRLTIVPVSKWLEDYCYDSMLRQYNIKLIHNGIDINKFNNVSAKAKKPTVLGVALPWTLRKGLQSIIKLRKIIPESKLDIVLVGLSKQQIKTLPKGILGIERTQNVRELADLYSKAHVFVNPTISDNFPTVNLEALACGTPVVTYQTGGSPEAISGNTGIVVEKNNINGLANAVKQIIDNPKYFSAENCRKRAVEYFNQDIQFNKYVDLYEELLNCK